MRGIGFAIFLVLLTACAQAEEGGHDALSWPSLLSAALPVLAVVMLMFWFQRAVQSRLQAKRGEEMTRKREREREKLARSLDRIIQARSKDPEAESDPVQPENGDPTDRDK